MILKSEEESNQIPNAWFPIPESDPRLFIVLKSEKFNLIAPSKKPFVEIEPSFSTVLLFPVKWIPSDAPPDKGLSFVNNASFTTGEGASSLIAAFCNTADNGFSLVQIEFASGEVIEKV